MCSNYVPVTREDRLLSFFGIEARGNDLPEGEVFPLGTIPIIRRVREIDAQPGERVLDRAVWRFVPDFVATLVRAEKGFIADKKRDPEWARNTFNARSEDVAVRKTYAAAWRAGQRCILPTEFFFEPRYFGSVEKPGKSERWRIQQIGGVPLGIAGLYQTVTRADTGEIFFAAAMVTVNADGHPVMSMFHRPGDEKRMPVILDPEDYTKWLECSVDEAQAMCRQWHGALEAFADVRPGVGPRQAGLF